MGSGVFSISEVSSRAIDFGHFIKHTGLAEGVRESDFLQFMVFC